MKYILGIDLGTSYLKFGIYDEALNLKGLGRVSVEKDTGTDDLCELPSERFINLIKTGISHACEKANIPVDKIDAIGYASQANSFILLDKNNNVLTPLILWPDTRAKDLHPEVIQLWHEKDFQHITGIGIQPSPQLCINKLLWFQKNKPEIWNKTACVLTISDYLVYLCTGQKTGDMGTASLLGLMNCQTGQWWDKAFEILKIDKRLFTTRLAVGEIAGVTNIEISKLIGIKEGAPFYIGSLDHHMAALGAGVDKTADISESTGTVLACVNFTKKYTPRINVCISPWKKGLYCQLAFDSNGASSLEWYQQRFAKEYSLSELINMAEKAGTSDGLIAKPMSFTYNSLDEAFTNIDKKHSHGHFIYALMESTANTLNDLIIQLCLDKKPKKIVSTGGGAKSELWRGIKTKITKCDFLKTETAEPATLGVAMLSLFHRTNSKSAYSSYK